MQWLNVLNYYLILIGSWEQSPKFLEARIALDDESRGAFLSLLSSMESDVIIACDQVRVQSMVQNPV